MPTECIQSTTMERPLLCDVFGSLGRGAWDAQPDLASQPALRLAAWARRNETSLTKAGCSVRGSGRLVAHFAESRMMEAMRNIAVPMETGFTEPWYATSQPSPLSHSTPTAIDERKVETRSS